MASKAISLASQHILLFGSTGVSGLAFVRHWLTLSPPSAPYLTLFIRPASIRKLPSELTNSSSLPSKVRIIEGALTDHAAITEALASTTTFPKCTTAVSFLGAYLSVAPIFTRLISTPLTPISDAFRDVVVPILGQHGVHRVLVLSTPTAVNSRAEVAAMTWKWWFYTWIPFVAAPQGSREMGGMAKAVSGGMLKSGMKEEEVKTIHRQQQEELKWTVFRVPNLTDSAEGGKEVVKAGMFDQEGGFEAGLSLTRESLVRWVMEELEKEQWVGRWPMLANA